MKKLAILISLLSPFIFILAQQSSGFGVVTIILEPNTTSTYQFQVIYPELNNVSSSAFTFTLTTSSISETKSSLAIASLQNNTSTLTFGSNFGNLNIYIGSCNLSSNQCILEFFYPTTTEKSFNLNIKIADYNILDAEIQAIQTQPPISIPLEAKIHSINVTPNILWHQAQTVKNPNYINFQASVTASSSLSDLFTITFEINGVSTSSNVNLSSNISSISLQLSLPSNSLPTIATSWPATFKISSSSKELASSTTYINFVSPPSSNYFSMPVTRISQFVQNQCINVGTININNQNQNIRVSFNKIERQGFGFIGCIDTENKNLLKIQGSSSISSSSVYAQPTTTYTLIMFSNSISYDYEDKTAYIYFYATSENSFQNITPSNFCNNPANRPSNYYCISANIDYPDPIFESLSLTSNNSYQFIPYNFNLKTGSFKQENFDINEITTATLSFKDIPADNIIKMNIATPGGNFDFDIPKPQFNYYIIYYPSYNTMTTTIKYKNTQKVQIIFKSSQQSSPSPYGSPSSFSTPLPSNPNPPSTPQTIINNINNFIIKIFNRIFNR